MQSLLTKRPLLWYNAIDMKMTAAIELDSIDLAILDILSQEARTPVAQIAERVGLSRPAVADRIEKLEKSGVIEGATLVLNPMALGRTVTAFVSAVYRGSMDAEAQDAFGRILERDEVMEAHSVAGEDCYLMKVRTDSIPSLNLLVNELSADPLAMTTRTTIVLETFHERVGGIRRTGEGT